MKRNITLAIVIIFIIGAIIIATHHNSPDQTPNGSGTTSAPHETINPNATATSTSGKTYTLAEVGRHPNATSCWTTIGGKVYDLTTWISQHPGGAQAILSICGKDGSVAFNNQHGGQARPAQELASFYIGDLVK
jgi:cytochrome b involved in lipid metabolism